MNLKAISAIQTSMTATSAQRCPAIRCRDALVPQNVWPDVENRAKPSTLKRFLDFVEASAGRKRGGQEIERGPLLAAIPNELPLIVADWAARRRQHRFAKLRSAMHADKVFHRDSCL